MAARRAGGRSSSWRLSIYPLLFSVWVAFVNYDFQIPGHAFVGLKNFQQVVFDPVARWSLVLTVVLSAANVTIEFLLGLALALAMVQDASAAAALVMSILIIPLFISPVIVGQAWALLLQRPFGPTNYLLGQLLGRDGHDQLADREPVDLLLARSSPMSGNGRPSCSSSCSPG